MTAKEIFDEYLSGEPLTEEAVIEALKEALRIGYDKAFKSIYDMNTKWDEAGGF